MVDEPIERNNENGSAGEQRLEEIARRAVRDEVSATDPDGERVSLRDLLDVGLTRRQALSVLGLVASGALAGVAVGRVVDDGGPDPAPSSTDRLSSLQDGFVVAVGPSLDGETVIDPDATTTPVQDALDAVQAAGGTVLLPPTTITEQETINLHSNTAIRGFWGLSTVRFPAGIDGVHADPGSDSGYLVYTEIDGVTFAGPGYDERDSGVAFRDYGLWLSRFGRVAFRDWNGPVWVVESGAGSFDNWFEYVYITQCDAGRQTEQGDGLVSWRSYGATNYFGYITAFPTSAASGTHSRLIATEGMAANISSINAGNNSGPVLSGYFNSLHIGTVHWEPTDQPRPAESIFELSGESPFSLDQLTLNVDASALRAYSVYDGGHMRLPIPHLADDATLEGGALRLENDPKGHIIYDGLSSDVAVEGSGSTDRCHCLSDFTSVG